MPEALLPWQESAWSRLLAPLEKGQLAHAYLVCGEQGIGKFQLMRRFATYLLCKNPDGKGPCGHCVNCALGVSGHHPDILVIAPEERGKAIKVDQIRALTEFVLRTSHAGMKKLILIDDAHQLNISAANSLLKTLEEPSADTVLFLVTERPGSLPATLRSRCQRLLLETPGTAATATWLQRQGLPPAEAGTLAVAAGGRPLYALALAEQDGVATAQDFLLSLTRLLQGQQTIQGVVATALKLGDGVAVEYLLRISTIVIRGLLTREFPEEPVIAELLQALSVDSDRLQQRVTVLLHFNTEVEAALRQLRGSTNPNPQLLLESLLWQWSRLARSRSPARSLSVGRRG